MFTRSDLKRVHQQLMEAIADLPDLGLMAGAEHMMASVNQIRAERGDGPARLSQVVALHEKTVSMPDPVRAYALQCALLALNPGHA